jgi:hypothetical protein
MYPYFDIDGISAEKLLREWKWLAPGEFDLLAVNAYGDLFLHDAHGIVHRLDLTSGTLIEVAASVDEFRETASDPEKKREWLLEDLAAQAGRNGCSPGKFQCIGGKIPFVFEQSATAPNNLYVADLYEYVSFMGDIHSQMKDVPDGGQVRLTVQPPPVEPHKREN